jgi:hypothetical protein
MKEGSSYSGTGEKVSDDGATRRAPGNPENPREVRAAPLGGMRRHQKKIIFARKMNLNERARIPPDFLASEMEQQNPCLSFLFFPLSSSYSILSYQYFSNDTPFSLTTFSIVGFVSTLSTNNAQHIVSHLYRHAESHYAEFEYAECQNAECRYAKCQYARFRYAEYHYAKHYYAQYHYVQYHYSKYQYAVIFYFLMNVVMLSVIS